jgi:hypothetical protein
VAAIRAATNKALINESMRPVVTYVYPRRVVDYLDARNFTNGNLQTANVMRTAPVAGAVALQ